MTDIIDQRAWAAFVKRFPDLADADDEVRRHFMEKSKIFAFQRVAVAWDDFVEAVTDSPTPIGWLLRRLRRTA